MVEAATTTDPVVISAMRLSNGDLRVAVQAADGTFSVQDTHVIDATKLPPVELPIGRGVKAFVDNGGTIGADPTPVPAVPGYVAPSAPAATPALSARQLRLWLVRNGIKLADVDAAIDGLPEGQRDEARIEWEHATEYHRDNPLIELVARLLDLSDEKVDAGFAVAATY